MPGEQERRAAREPVGGTSATGRGRRPIVSGFRAQPNHGAPQGAEGRSGDSANRGQGGWFSRLVLGQPGTPGGKRER